MKTIFLSLSFLKRALSIFSFAFTLAAFAQTPQWNWAKSAGGSVNDAVQGNFTTINLDSAGNVYEVVGSNSGSISFGSFSFTNPNGATPSYSGLPLIYFVKYSPQGTVLWAKQYRNGPGGYVIPGPNSLFVRPDGTAYLHFAMTLDSIVVGNKVAYNNAINFFNPGACIAQYDASGNVVRLSTYAKPYGGWSEIMPLPNNQMLALTTINNIDTINNTPVSPGSLLAILDSTGNVLKLKNLGYDSNSIFNHQPIVASGRYIAVNQKSIYLIMSPTLNTHYNLPAIPFDSAYAGTLVVKLDTGLNFIWAKPLSKHFGNLISTDELDNVYLPFTAQSKDTVSIDTIVVPFPFRYLGQFYGYLGLAKLNADGAAQWVDTILIASAGGGGATSVCADRLGNSYLSGYFSAPTYVGPDTLQNGGNLFVAKYSSSGNVKWVQTTQNANGRINYTYNCMAEDGHGNIYLNGNFSDPNVRPFFGHDSLVVHSPINNYPLAPDVFLARLGNCSPPSPAITASSSLTWCGVDSVVLSTNLSAGYLWNNSNTASSIVVHRSGNYSVYTYDTLGCYAQSIYDTVVTYPQPVLHSLTQDVRCRGDNSGQIHLQTDSATGSVNYSFSPPVNDTLNMAAGVYAITATDNAGCIATDTLVINEPANSLSIITGSSPSTGNNGKAFVSATGGTPPYVFSWGQFQSGDTIINLAPGWYTLIVSDSNGCTSTDSVYVPMITGMQSVQQCNISIYPNPANNSFTIETSATGEQFLKVFDMAGKMILSQTIQNSKTTISASSLAAGIYSVSLKNSEGSTTKKLIIEK